MGNNQRSPCLPHVRGQNRRRAPFEGDVESAYDRLEEARHALDRDNYPWARRAVDEALELLRTDESRLIVEDVTALENAIGLLGELRFE